MKVGTQQLIGYIFYNIISPITILAFTSHESGKHSNDGGHDSRHAV